MDLFQLIILWANFDNFHIGQDDETEVCYHGSLVSESYEFTHADAPVARCEIMKVGKNNFKIP